MPHDSTPAWKRISELTADRDFWKRAAEAKYLEVHRSTREAMARLRQQLGEARKVIKRMRRITHCKQCRCSDNPRKEYFRQRYLTLKNK